MVSLESLQHSHFTELIGQPFALEGGGVKAELILAEAHVLGHKRTEAFRDPFALTFQGKQGWRLPQGIYHLAHEKLGTLEIFITQIGDGAQGSTFEAIFT